MPLDDETLQLINAAMITSLDGAPDTRLLVCAEVAYLKIFFENESIHSLVLMYPSLIGNKTKTMLNNHSFNGRAYGFNGFNGEFDGFHGRA
jgi:hypothetical protein